MKKLLSVLCFTVFAGISGNAFADWYKAAAEPNLVVRDSPDVSGNKLGNVPYGGKVNVIERVGGKESIGGRSGYWVKIQWKSGDGYAFDTFLESLDDNASSESSSSLSDIASDKCEDGTKTLFRCIAQKNGKKIEVCDAGKTINYSFGKPGKKPELSISILRDDVTAEQWNGVGDFFYNVSIPSGDFLYRIFWTAERNTDEHAIEAGVEVTKKDKLLATIYCQEDTIEQLLDGVDLKHPKE